MHTMKRMSVRFEEKSRIIPPAPRVVVPDAAGGNVGSGQGQSQSSNNDGGIEVRTGTEKEAGSWNYAFGPPPPGVDPEFDRRVASELARIREIKGGGREEEDRLIKKEREMMRDERQENRDSFQKNVDSQLGGAKEWREMSANIPEEVNFENDVAVALKEMEGNNLTLQHHHRQHQQQSESLSRSNVDSNPLMHLDARHSAEGQHRIGSDILSKPNNLDPPQSHVYERTHHVNGGLPNLYTDGGNNSNPATYSHRRYGGGLASMWQGEEGSALQRGETREKQNKYRHELEEQINARQQYQQAHRDQQQKCMPLGYQHAITSVQQPLMGRSDARHPQATATTPKRSHNLPSHASPLVGVSCNDIDEERGRIKKEEYAEELRKQIAEKNKRKALQLQEEEAMLAEEMQWEKYDGGVRKSSSRQHGGGEETSGSISAPPFHGIGNRIGNENGNRNRLHNGMERDDEAALCRVAADLGGVTMPSSPPPQSPSPSAFVVEHGSHHVSSSGLSARQRLMEDVYGSSAGQSIQLWGTQGRESGTDDAEKARKKSIALEQRRALEEQIENKRRLREEDEVRKRQEEEEEQRRMMHEQIAYENEQQAIREKQLAEEQQRLELLYEQQRQDLLKKSPTRHTTAEVACNNSTRDPLVPPVVQHHQSQSCSNDRTEAAVPCHTSSHCVPESEAVNDNPVGATPLSSGAAQEKEAQGARVFSDGCIVRKTEEATDRVNSYSLTGSGAELPHRFNNPNASSFPCFEPSGSTTTISSPPLMLHGDNNTLHQQTQIGVDRQQRLQQLDQLDLSPRSEDTTEQSLAGPSRFVAVNSPSYKDGQQDGDGLSGDSLLMYLSAQQLEQEKTEELERENRMMSK